MALRREQVVAAGQSSHTLSEFRRTDSPARFGQLTGAEGYACLSDAGEGALAWGAARRGGFYEPGSRWVACSNAGGSRHLVAHAQAAPWPDRAGLGPERCQEPNSATSSLITLCPDDPPKAKAGAIDLQILSDAQLLDELALVCDSAHHHRTSRALVIPGKWLS